jgi:Flp pilus assembly pilin Flp
MKAKYHSRILALHGQRGQALLEYTVIAVILAASLLAPVPGVTPSQTVGQLVSGKIHDLYDNISFFLSLP